MKILICGKGGSGKSTLAALLSRNLTGRGFEVLLIDADESNFGLHRLAGVPMPKDIMEELGGKKGFKEKLNKTFPGEDQPFSEKIKISDLPEACVGEEGGIKLAAIGKIHDFGEGCACPMGVLSKKVLSNLILDDKEIVVVDTEAGIEHFGRRVDAECDLILGVVDPTFESFLMAEKMTEMAEKAGVEIFFVLNKVSDHVVGAMKKKIDQKKIIAEIPQSEEIFMESLEGNRLTTALPAIDAVGRLIEERKTG
jgi:CO dehydrogenase maturation factor